MRNTTHMGQKRRLYLRSRIGESRTHLKGIMVLNATAKSRVVLALSVKRFPPISYSFVELPQRKNIQVF